MAAVGFWRIVQQAHNTLSPQYLRARETFDGTSMYLRTFATISLPASPQRSSIIRLPASTYFDHDSCTPVNILVTASSIIIIVLDIALLVFIPYGRRRRAWSQRGFATTHRRRQRLWRAHRSPQMIARISKSMRRIKRLLSMGLPACRRVDIYHGWLARYFTGIR